VEDVALLVDALSADRPPAAPSMPEGNGVEGTRVGLVSGTIRQQADPRIWEVVQTAANDLEAMGARIEEIEIHELEAAIDALRSQLLSEAAAYHRERLEGRPDLFGSDVLTRLRVGASVTGMEYALARETTRAWRRVLMA